MRKLIPEARVRWIRRARVAAAALVLGIIAASVFFKTDLGTLCAWCPIGLAQASAAAREFMPGILVALVVFAALALVVGRAFCSWGCPSNLVKRRVKLPGKKSRNALTLYRCLLVGGLVAVSFAVGFPVFCLICPIGLVFGFFFAVFKSLTIYQPSWDLIIFPLMLFVELRLLRSWCRLICPIGALFSLIARISPRKLGVWANKQRCRSQAGCHACEDACAQEIPSVRIGKTANESCTLCLECTGACPQGALQSRVAFAIDQKGDNEGGAS